MSRIEGPKPKPVIEPKTVEAPKEAAPVETVAEVASPPAGPKLPGNGFDDLKKKLLSVSGRFAPSKAPVAERADLKDLISSMRLAFQAGTGGQSVGPGFEPVEQDTGGRRLVEAQGPKGPAQLKAQDAIKNAPAVPKDDPHRAYTEGVRAELKKLGLPQNAEGVRVMVVGENTADHGAAVVRSVAGEHTGLGVGANVSLTGSNATVQQIMDKDPRKAEFDKIQDKIRAGTATIDDMAKQGVMGADASLTKMQLAIADARKQLPKPPDGKATMVNMSWGESPYRLAQQLAANMTKGGENAAVKAAAAKWASDNGETFDANNPQHIAGAIDVLANQIAEQIAKKMDASPSPAKKALEKELADARKDGMLVFNSAGNDFMKGGERGGRNVSHDVKGMITVGNVKIGDPKNKKDDELAWESSGGQVEIAAPGSKMPVGKKTDGSVEHLDGTSFSSPYLAGVAALMVKANPKITPDQIEKILLDPKNRTAVGQGSHVGNVGLIDPAKAVLAASKLK